MLVDQNQTVRLFRENVSVGENPDQAKPQRFRLLFHGRRLFRNRRSLVTFQLQLFPPLLLRRCKTGQRRRSRKNRFQK